MEHRERTRRCIYFIKNIDPEVIMGDLSHSPIYIDAIIEEELAKAKRTDKIEDIADKIRCRVQCEKIPDHRPRPLTLSAY